MPQTEMDEQIKALINPSTLNSFFPEKCRFERMTKYTVTIFEIDINIKRFAVNVFQVASVVRLDGHTYSPVMLVSNVIAAVEVLEMAQWIGPVNVVAATFFSTIGFRFFS